MPAGWQWMNRLSPTTWILYGLAGSQLCDSDQQINVRRWRTCRLGQGWGWRPGREPHAQACHSTSTSSGSDVKQQHSFPFCRRRRCLPPLQAYGDTSLTVSAFMEQFFGYKWVRPGAGGRRLGRAWGAAGNRVFAGGAGLLPPCGLQTLARNPRVRNRPRSPQSMIWPCVGIVAAYCVFFRGERGVQEGGQRLQHAGAEGGASARLSVP